MGRSSNRHSDHALAEYQSRLISKNDGAFIAMGSARARAHWRSGTIFRRVWSSWL